MSMTLFVPVVLGVLTVLQATLNRELARAWGLAPAAVLNMLVALSLALIVLSVGSARGAGEGLFRMHVDLSVVRWWWLLPGFCGCALVFGLPWAVDKLGALPVFIVLVGTQVCASAAWDSFVAEVPLSTPRVLAACLAVASVVLASWK